MWRRDCRSMIGWKALRSATAARTQRGWTTIRARDATPASIAPAASATELVRAGGPLSLPRIRAPSALASAPRTMSVSIQLKYATPTSTPSGRASTRSAFANASTPDFEAE